MTSRLKKKLDNLGLDPSSSKLNESFCLIGTPLPPLEKSKDTGEFVPVWKQEVRDEQGRRRLHGAFTGGFSAGYFNTVGSKEGWAPSTFVSSRSDRAKQKAARPEDFMDDEDLAELQDSKKLVDTTQEMDILGGTQAAMHGRDAADPDDPMATALAAMLPSVRDSAGAQLLKKMGWRAGQGVGPRVTYKQLRVQDKLSSAAPGPELPEDDEANKHLYAPRDTKITPYQRKDNSFGLAYVPGRGLTDIVQSSAPAAGPNLSAGFGLGALNDAEDDDIDVYEGGIPGGNQRRMAYDIAEDDEDDGGRISIGNRSTARASQPSKAEVAPSAITFHDGRLVLSGFILSEKPVAEDVWFEIPSVPAAWTPDPKRVWSQDPDNHSIPVPEIAKGPVAHNLWKQGISADQRGALLGETPLPAKTKSVFDYLSEKDRERLLNFKKLAPSSDAQPSSPSVPPVQTTIIIPPTDPRTAEGALRGFQPFTGDPVKQSRYNAYLQSQVSVTPLKIDPLPGKSINDFNLELAEYAKSALIFKPSTGAIANRFTSASVEDTGPNIQEGLYQPTAKTYLDAEEEERGGQVKKVDIQESPKEYAAKMGMFGHLTREEVPWTPAGLLCKRFGLRARAVDQDDENSAPSAAAAGAKPAGPTPLAPLEFITVGSSLEGKVTQQSHEPSSTSRKDPTNVGLGEDESQGAETLTYQKPGMDIFKAIFASDDEDSGDEDNDDDATAHDQNSNNVKEAPTATSEVVATDASLPPAAIKPEPPRPENVDLATFRPTFVSKAQREGIKPTEENKKRTKEKSARKNDAGAVSFAMDVDGEEESIVIKPKKRKSEKEKSKGSSIKKKRKVGEHDEDMWVEKAAAPATATAGASAAATQSSTEPVIGKASGRARAVDFL